MFNISKKIKIILMALCLLLTLHMQQLDAGIPPILFTVKTGKSYEWKRFAAGVGVYIAYQLILRATEKASLSIADSCDEETVINKKAKACLKEIAEFTKEMQNLHILYM